VTRLCSIDGCERKHFGHGLCNTHYVRWRRHGDPLTLTRKAATSYGVWHHPLYESLRSAQRRCNEPQSKDYPHYGGRGIKLYEPWQDMRVFIAWIEDNLGPRPEGLTLDRIDTDGDYEPGNLRWASRSEQSKNRRPFKRAGKEKNH
jgi:hypothetical protein